MSAWYITLTVHIITSGLIFAIVKMEAGQPGRDTVRKPLRGFGHRLNSSRANGDFCTAVLRLGSQTLQNEWMWAFPGILSMWPIIIPRCFNGCATETIGREDPATKSKHQPIVPHLSLIAGHIPKLPSGTSSASSHLDFLPPLPRVIPNSVLWRIPGHVYRCEPSRQARESRRAEGVRCNCPVRGILSAPIVPAVVDDGKSSSQMRPHASEKLITCCVPMPT